MAKSSVAYKVLCLFFKVDGSSAYENASVVAFIANEEGKKAARVLSQNEDGNDGILPGAAFHMPALNISMKNK